MLKSQSNFWIYIFIVFVLVAFPFFLNVVLGWTIGGDSEWYIVAAKGRLHELIEPYSSRFLHPFAAGLLNRVLSLNIHQSFLILTAITIFLFFLINAVILKDTIDLPPLLMIPLFLLPYFFHTIREIYQPDPLYIFLTSLFFLFLFLKKEAGALLSLLFLFLARETTVLLAIILIAISFWKSKKLLAAGAIFVLLISFYISGVLKDIGEPNIHDFGGSAYLISKLTYNFSTNVLGLKPWVAGLKDCEPIFKTNLPGVGFLKNFKEAGICGFDFSLPLKTLTILLTTFGIAPLVIFYVFKKHGHIFKNLPFWMLTALIYGLSFYFIGVVAGTGIQRIVGYGWPVFLIIAPILINAVFETDRKFIIKLSLLQFLTAWFPLFIYKTAPDAIGAEIFIIIFAVIGYLYGLRVLKSQKTRAGVALSFNN